MPPAARLTDLHTCPMETGPVPHVGGPVIPPGSAPTVLINGLPAATVGTMATCVGPPDTIVKGSTGVFINGKPAARLGDLTAHGGAIVTGSPNVIIGEVGEASPGSRGMGGVMAGMAASVIPASFGSFVRRYPENRILCTLICFCNLNPDISSRGYRLKQRCVSSSLKAINAALGGHSPFKPEVSYNTATTPPRLLPDASSETPEGYDRWRPDVVIVTDPRKGPEPDNISRVVEMKFPPDYLGADQQQAYEKIAGGPDKFEVMGPAECGCDTEGMSRLAKAALIAGLIVMTAELLAEMAAAAAAAGAAVVAL